MNWLRPNLSETVKSLSMGLFKASFQLINQKGAGHLGANKLILSVPGHSASTHHQITFGPSLLGCCSSYY